MAKEREQQKKAPKKTSEEAAAAQASPEVQKKGQELKEDMDRLLDEIDSVLEENAEEFIKNYVQKGGQ
jgi:ubiquitin-like protein Pup